MTRALAIEQLEKTYADQSLVLKNISLAMAAGDNLSILGPSGSGKTTLLRLIAGLEIPDSGDIRFKGRSVLDVPPHKRNFGIMFQDFALFPHMNVYGNIAFGLKMKGLDRVGTRRRVSEMLDLTGLTGYETRHVDDLSGGERQRVALARTLAPEPDLLLLDEPLSSLDRVLRRRLLKELMTIIGQLALTSIFVTHDHEEAFAAGRQIIVMNHGEIIQKGTESDLLTRPASKWVKDFFSS